MTPANIDPDGTPVFTNLQIDNYGLPELWGYEKYLVRESRDAVFVTDYKMEQEMYLQKTHRYCRFSRFKTCLLNLLGERGNIPPMVLSMVRSSLKKTSTDLWNDTRRILKHYKQRKYYDNIPMLIRMTIGVKLFPSLTSEKITEILNDFKYLSTQFEKKKITRRYFPNIRYIVLRLLQYHKVDFAYSVPKARTSRKLKTLDQLWESLME